MQTKECPICSNQFLATPPNKLWCSPECKYKASQERSKKHYLIWRDDSSIHNIEKICEVCSNTFFTGIRKLIEIKPRAFIEYDITLAKAATAKALCANESMLFETWMLDRIHKKQLDESYVLKKDDIDIVC